MRELYGKDIAAACPPCNRADNKLLPRAAGTAAVAGSTNANASGGILGTGITWTDVRDFVVDLIIPGGVGGAGAGSDIVLQGGASYHSGMTTPQPAGTQTMKVMATPQLPVKRPK